ncbi:MAG: TonB family protein [Acidobacteria bacterium]|nr:TonB family protein [Acidobacteriota bacterium]
MKGRLQLYRFGTISALILAFVGCAYPQAIENSAVVNWQNYRDKESKVVFSMPKMPILITEADGCLSQTTKIYGSYAKGTAYVVRITKKLSGTWFCQEKKEFGRESFENRAAELKQGKSGFREDENRKSGPDEINLIAPDKIIRLVFDSRNDRWFELEAVNADAGKPVVDKFLASLSTDKKARGVEIGEGSPVTLGDFTETESVAVSPPVNKTAPELKTANDETMVPLKIVLKSRANYTDAARTSKVQGRVQLRVTFAANGGITDVSVISGLAEGLTEQAIAAARKILFIPPSRNGIKYSVTKPVEYSFTIY